MTVFEDANGAKFEELATNALANDNKRNDKIRFAENVHRRLIKAGAKGDDFKTKAQSFFKYAKYFQAAASTD